MGLFSFFRRKPELIKQLEDLLNVQFKKVDVYAISYTKFNKTTEYSADENSNVTGLCIVDYDLPLILKIVTDAMYVSNNNFSPSLKDKLIRLNLRQNGIASIYLLEKFVNLSQTKNEKENKLEQLRALDNKIKINVTLAKFSPIGVDTDEDYLAIKKIMEYKLNNE